MNDKFHVHELDWDREYSSRIWDYYAEKLPPQAYFSHQRGDSLIRLAKSFIPKFRFCRVLDFGCGPGYLLTKLCALQLDSHGCDFSRQSVDRAQSLVGGEKRLGGIHLINSLPSTLPSGEFDVVFLVETIEHLLDIDLEPTLIEVCRLLRNGGHLVITTPHDENLDAAKVICPESGAVFHPMQHVQSWTAASLSKAVERFGLTGVYCKPTFLAEPTWASKLRGIGMRLLRMKLPHLVYIGQKKA